jgi:hypothetical protein
VLFLCISFDILAQNAEAASAKTREKRTLAVSSIASLFSGGYVFEPCGRIPLSVFAERVQNGFNEAAQKFR